tara:strand:+ start:1292 stop:2173 length:882 start_codon:yes stop_codon:yes gene_type:complete
VFDLKILVTGGKGRIGSILTESLRSKGNEVETFDLVDGQDILDFDSLNSAIKDKDLIYHLAAIDDVGTCFSNPELMMNVNGVGTANLLKAASQSNVEKVVIASSVFCYHGKEDNEENFVYDYSIETIPYSSGKILQEFVSQLFVKNYGINVVLARYNIPIGPTITNVVHALGNRMLNNEDITIFGDGLQGRNYLWIDDLVSGNILLGESKSKGAYNISGNQFYTILDIVDFLKKSIEQVTGSRWSGKLGFAKSQGREFLGVDVNSDKIKDLGWEQSTTVQDAITNTVKYLFEK